MWTSKGFLDPEIHMAVAEEALRAMKTAMSSVQLRSTTPRKTRLDRR